MVRLTLIVDVDAQPIYDPTPTSNRLAFTYGEKLVYKVRYNLYFDVNVGKVTFKVDEEPVDIDGVPTMHAEAVGRTFGFYDPFFKVRDRFETYMAPNRSMKPVSFMRIIREGGYSKDVQVTFNHEASKVQSVNLKKGRVREFEIPEGTYDVLSVLYAARCFDYHDAQPGDTYFTNIFLGDTTYSVKSIFKGREEVKTQAGRFRCIKLSPRPIAGDVFDEDSHMVIWVTDDQNLVPVRIESDISVGAIRADLDSYKGLKYKMNALVD